jgi:acyl-CoA dehydrogenase
MREIFDSTIERLFLDLVTPQAVMSCEGGVWPEAMWDGIEESGFTLALAPESAGGAGAAWADVCGIVRLAGRFSLPLPLPEAMLANWLLGVSGLQGCGGRLTIGAQGTLRFENGTVSGDAIDVPWGSEVDFIVAVIAGDEPRVVLLPTYGVQKIHGANIAGEPRDTLVFNEVVPLATELLPLGLSDDVLRLGGAMLRSAQIAGALECGLALTTTYAGERVQFGKPIASFQAIQHQVSVLAEHTAASAIAAEAAFAESSNERLADFFSMAAKICSSEAAGIGAGIAHAVHGAIGFTHEHALHLTTRRLWAWRSEFGSLTEWSKKLGYAACSGGAKEFWPAITSGQLHNLKGVPA